MSTAIESQRIESPRPTSVTEILDITKLVLQADQSHAIKNRVTVVRGWAQLSEMYPTESKYRDDLTRSTIHLAGKLAYFGHLTLAMRVCSAAQGIS